MLNVDVEDIYKRVRKILARMVKLKESAVTLGSHLRDDLGVDSVDIWDIMTKMEEEFDIDVEEGDAAGVETVQDVINIVKSKMKAAKK